MLTHGMAIFCAATASAVAMLVFMPSSSNADYAADFVCMNPDGMQKTRFVAIREGLLAKLNLGDPNLAPYSDAVRAPTAPPTAAPSTLDPDLLSAYNAAVRVGQSRARESSGCNGEGGWGTPFAKRIHMFFPEESSLVYFTADMLEEEDNDSQNSKNAPSKLLVNLHVCLGSYSSLSR